MSAVEAARPVKALPGPASALPAVDDDAEEPSSSGPAGAPGIVEEHELASFEHVDEYRALLAQFIQGISDNDSSRDAGSSKGSQVETTPGSRRTGPASSAKAQAPNPYQNSLVAKMLDLLSPYQEQPYLLDPYLDELVLAPVQALQKIIRACNQPGIQAATTDLGSPKLQELAVLIYWYTKIRGDKVITRFFPHEVDDLLPVIICLERLSHDLRAGAHAQPGSTGAVWELRYVLLLWLSLVCMIPFDLRQLDEAAAASSSTSSVGSGLGTTVSDRIEQLGRTFLASPGKERDAAAVMMGKLFQRRDLKTERLARFLEWSKQQACSADASVFIQTGIMQALCEIIKVSDPASIEQHLRILQDLFEALDLTGQAGAAPESQNVLVLRYQAKMACRLGLKLLKPRKIRRTNAGKALDENLQSAGRSEAVAVISTQDHESVEDEDVPEDIDLFVSKLLTCLESKDTAVRYSAAKGIARLCERLPPSFISQLTGAVRDLFTINVIERSPTEIDVSTASEHTWQGACMAIAELARRGLLAPGELEETMKWILRALTFDVRRGANSVGSAVRDAACYVLWALARAHTNAEALRSHSEAMATQLLIVATLDREVSIRRAASAAFQECVGRMGNIPHDIDVLRKTDFYAVGVRRNAFLRCATEVAVHDVYRPHLLDHLLTVTISHWDRSMRTLAAAGIRAIVALDFDGQAKHVATRLLEMVSKPDTLSVHGTLLALSQLAELTAEHADSKHSQVVLSKCFEALHRAPLSVLRSVGAAWPLYASCELIRTSSSAVQTLGDRTEDGVPANTLEKWDAVLDQALARQEEYVHDALAAAHGSMSRIYDPTPRIQRILQGWKSLHPTRQQSNALLLGSTCFVGRPELFELTLSFLLSLLEKQNSAYSNVIEVRRNAVRSIHEAISGLGADFATIYTVELSDRTLGVLLACLEDYTVDQRGDVGSWVRIASLSALRQYVEVTTEQIADPQTLLSRISKERLNEIMAGMLKQTVERIDSVRAHAGSQLVAIRKCSPPLPDVEGADLLAKALPEGEALRFQDAAWTFPRIVTLLEVPAYRIAILRGVATSVASKSDMAQRTVGTSLLDWAKDREGRVGMLLRELYSLAVKNFGSNTTFVPVITTATLLIEGATAEDPSSPADADLAQKFCRLCTQNVDKMKSLARVQASAALCVNLLRVPSARSKAVDALPIFFLHSFTAVRTATAEQLYVVLQDVVEDELPEEAETILLNTKWAHRVQKVQTAKLQDALRANICQETF
ncbi:hypothetical protein V8E36_000136 [Tilletia maclaganii]